MPRRHAHRPGDWDSVAARLDEILGAHSGEDPFEQALLLLVAGITHELSDRADRPFLHGAREASAARSVDRLLDQAAARWPGLLDPGARTRLGGLALLRCAEVLRSVPLLSGGLVGLDAIFERLVTRAAKGEKGQYFTPRHVISELVEMVAPRPGERVIDPACGSGGFLRHALARGPGCSVWGFDMDPRAVRVARVMMAACGQPVSRVHQLDSLLGPPSPGALPPLEARLQNHDPGAAGFDVVLANPPFAGDVGRAYEGVYQLASGRRAERDVLFLERCVGLLRPGGRYAIILPYNKLGGAAFRHVRSWLLHHTRVVAVLGLDRATFLPHTSQKTCVLLGLKRPRPLPPPADEEIFFFLGERPGKDNRGRLLLTADGAIDHDLGEATAPVRERFGLLTPGPSTEIPARGGEGARGAGEGKGATGKTTLAGRSGAAPAARLARRRTGRRTRR